PLLLKPLSGLAELSRNCSKSAVCPVSASITPVTDPIAELWTLKLAFPCNAVLFWMYALLPLDDAKPQAALLSRQTVPLSSGKAMLRVAVGVVKLSVPTLAPLLTCSWLVLLAWKA